MFLMTQVNHCQGRAVKNLYDICPNRRHSKEHDNSLQHIPELSKLLRKKVQQLQDDYVSILCNAIIPLRVLEVSSDRYSENIINLGREVAQVVIYRLIN